VVCGDLVHAYPTDQHAQQRQVADYKRIMNEVHPDIPLVCLCGNHDVGDAPDRASIELYKKRFGDDYLSFWVGGVKFIVLNSQMYKDKSRCVQMAAEQDAWLQSELDPSQSSGAQHLVVFSHIMPFVYSSDEPSGYFNLAEEVRRPLLARLLEAGASKWFCGHYHRNAGGCCDNGQVGDDRREMEVIITAAVGSNLVDDPRGDVLGLSGMGAVELNDQVSGFRLVKVRQSEIEHQYFALKELEST